MRELQLSGMCYWEGVLMTLVNHAKSTQNNTNPRQPSGIFTCFSKIPFELRRTIWIFTLPGPRPDFIKTRPKIPNIHNSDSYDYVRVITTPPALLHKSHESREVASVFYELSFGGISQGHPVYIDFRMDILFLKGWGSVACLRDEIEILEVPLYPDYYQIIQKTKTVGILKKMFDVLYLVPWQRLDLLSRQLLFGLVQTRMCRPSRSRSWR
jgi:hypothetical protein